MTTTLPEAIHAVLAVATQPLSPVQIRERVKIDHPHLYQTEAHRAGIERGNYTSFDHALLNPIYSIVTKSADFIVDRSSKPMRISLAAAVAEDAVPGEDYESDVGLVYVLSTGMHTSKGLRIIKIGHTTQPLAVRIAQLYTTGTPFQFQELLSWKTRNYTELEQALHKLMAPYRINRAREFFTEEALQFVDAIATIHTGIQARVNGAATGA